MVMSKYELAAAIGFVLVAKGACTHGMITLRGSDRALVAEFGDIFKGMTVVVDGLNNIIRAYVTPRSGVIKQSLSVVNGVIVQGSLGGYDERSQQVQSHESYKMI
jgi:ABC-type uncharacterized transport system permease subunit